MFLLTAALVALAAACLLLQFTPPQRPASARASLTTAAHFYEWPGGQAPRGITLSGLQDYIINSRTISMMRHQSHATTHFWDGRDLRDQITQDRFVGASGRKPDLDYQRKVFQVVAYQLSLGATVVLNAQTEAQTGYPLSEPLPTYATTVFWRVMLAHYAHNPRIIMDLFNEPRPVCPQTGSRLPSACTWAMWSATMLPLYHYVRARTRDWIWLEGIDWASTLHGVPLFHGFRTAYSFHHPGQAHSGTQHTAVKVWWSNFGYIAAAGYPVVDGEFPNFVGSYDWFHPLRTMKAYIAYLASHHIGILVWSLVPGSLNSDLSYTSMSIEPQGDGYLIHQWFARLARAARGTPRKIARRSHR